MNNNPNLRRIRRVVAGICAAAILALAGLTVEIAWEQGEFASASIAAGAAGDTPLVGAAADSVVLPAFSKDGGQTPVPTWTPTPPVQSSSAPPQTNTAGS